ncbi:unnamed protein product [Linum trigynum]|uniref:CCHC-type domain-containing protein n=1 Tax=Linum trigynum TaxID=586398 RepID=A0AAV2DW48_9ROSI
MDSGKLEVVSAKLDGKNFPFWEFQFRSFVAGKRLLLILTGQVPQPAANSSDKDKADWEASNAHMISLLLGSIDMGTGLSLCRFYLASEMWSHICSLYSQNNASRQFEIESELATFTQGDRDIRSYYQALVTRWTEQDMLVASFSDTPATAASIRDRDRSRLMQFLMKLRPEFEAVRASILHRNVSSIDEALSELFREETRLRSLSRLGGSNDTAFAIGRAGGSRPHFQQSGTSHLTCHYCREVGHIQPHCRQNNFCIYCKQSLHIVLDCKEAARRNRGGSSSRSRGSGSSAGSRGDGPAGASYVVTPAPVGAPALVSTLLPGLTSADVRRLVAEAFQDALPLALNSAFATGGGKGSDHGENSGQG